MQPVSLDRMVRAVEKVRQRLLRSTAALENSGIPYAVIGGNAVAAWVSRVDEAAVRNTQDVDILIRRSDLDRVKRLWKALGSFTVRPRMLSSFSTDLTQKCAMPSICSWPAKK